MRVRQINPRRPWRSFRRFIERIWGPESFWPIISILSICLIVIVFLSADNRRQWREVDYPELRYPASSLRVFHIEPGTGKESVRGVLKSYSLAERPQFEALTYTWGDMKHSKTITVNGKRMKISRNLHEALLSIRHPTKSRTLWIDQICINQNSKEELNSQIPLMTHIYSRAEAALAWVGNHKGPRWAEGADELDWSGEWAVNHASR